VLCLLFAEIWLVESEYYAFGELSSRWWLAICLLVLIVSLAVLTGAITIRAISAFRGRSDDDVPLLVEVQRWPQRVQAAA
jgi:hypothetical protein